MSVFRNYNSAKAGGVNANAFPRVHPIPWVPTQRNVRENPNIPTQPQRIQPHERGTFFPTSASGGGTLAPSMSSGCTGCGCGGGGDTASQIATSTAQDLNTGHAFPIKGTTARTNPTAMQPIIPIFRSGGVNMPSPAPTRGTMNNAGSQRLPGRLPVNFGTVNLRSSQGGTKDVNRTTLPPGSTRGRVSFSAARGIR